ncbi:MAG: hypothetical protein DRO40_12385 [Thermoprotei archaeon]|nr:MAG: hypothetical protein DRO40_12385 [Thermoprotei archaeon]
MGNVYYVLNNILYATVLARRAFLLTMDKALKEFLQKHDLSTNIVLSHKELFKKVNDRTLP